MTKNLFLWAFFNNEINIISDKATYQIHLNWSMKDVSGVCDMDRHACIFSYLTDLSTFVHLNWSMKEVSGVRDTPTDIHIYIHI